ncbi:hypothetical protein [Pseudomonas sp. 1152_12]|uniref:hypothetical protein n=1 Tax=Pseudomonas sp. 1152_12 TaxID=2604455 RepID=UPI0040644CDF
MISAAALADELPRSEQIKALHAAGFNQEASECEIEETGNYTPVTIERVEDFNGDSRPDALITEGSSSCYGQAGTGFYLVSQQPDGDWKLMLKESGLAEFLASQGTDGWPDVEVSGPGFCFPVMRYDGQRYRAHHRVGERCAD